VGRGGRSVVRQGVVASIRAVQGDTGDVHRLVVRGVLVDEGAAGGRHSEGVAANHAGEVGIVAVQGRIRGAVVDLVIRRDAGHRADRGLADVGLGGRRAGEVDLVVVRVV